MPLEDGFADVAVIMPAYKAEATIARALGSVAAQTVKPREVVVVDDGSPDGTSAAVEAMMGAMNGIDLKLFRQDNAGAGAARNRALKEATATWVAFLDADDEWLPAKIERSMAVLEAGNYTLVAHDYEENRDGVKTHAECARRFMAAGDDPLGELYRRGYIDTCSVVTEREAVLAVGGFDATLPVGQDFDLILKVLERDGATFTVFPDPLVRYYITPGSITSNTDRRLACQMRILLRHAPALKRGRLRSVLFRTLAVHKEALDAHRMHGRWGGVVRTLIKLPFNLLRGLL